MIAALFAGLALSWLAEYPPLFRAEPAVVDSLLADERWVRLGKEEKLLALARLRTGTPYALGCLGEEAPPDTDPIFRLDRADCTVLVVTDAALLGARSLEEARALTRAIHYRDGVPSFATRFHFTSDRIASSPWFEEITASAVPDSALVPIRVTLNRKASGEALLPIDWSRERTMRYLPAGRIDERILDRLPRACGVAFVDESNARSGYLVSHEGILLERRTLHHASSAAGAVVDIPLLEYLRDAEGGTRFDGVLFFSFR